MRTFEENLALYAKLAIRGGVNLQPGQELLLYADIADAVFARLIAAEAYKSGAKNVHILYGDEQAVLIRYKDGNDEAMHYAPNWFYDGLTVAMKGNTSRLGILSSDPNLLKNVAPEKIANYSKTQGLAMRSIMDIITQGQINWSLVGAPSPAWAKQVFPGDEEKIAVQKLWDAIFSVSRVLEDDPIASWTNHCDSLEKRQEWMNQRRFTEVHFTGPGTDLKVGLAENSIWQGGWGHSTKGIKHGPNVPTEEVFSMPHRLNVNGKVSSTKPLSVRGQVVDGIEVEFKDGAIIKASAKKGEDTFLKLLDTDPGAKHLGEVALVPNSSKVSQSNVLFYNTLYDENAASHIALGKSYAGNMPGYPTLTKQERLEKGSNDSLIHVDWMIGSSEINVSAKSASGPVKLMEAGEWVEKL